MEVRHPRRRLCPDDVNTSTMQRRWVKYPQAVLVEFIQPEDLAQTMKLVALLPPRTSIPEMIVTRTRFRLYTPAESGVPSRCLGGQSRAPT